MLDFQLHVETESEFSVERRDLLLSLQTLQIKTAVVCGASAVYFYTHPVKECDYLYSGTFTRIHVFSNLICR